MIEFKRLVFGRVAISIFSFCFCLTALADRGVPASEGIENFGRVNDSLFRGAQPDADGIKHLQALGVKTIINLRTAKGALKEEAAQARACGITYTNTPLAGMGKPTDEEVKKILALIVSSPGPVYVHCEHGCDRTGTIIACYRIKYDYWTRDQAMHEADHYGMSFWERGMRKYIAKFAKTAAQPSAPKP